jgi:Ribbon-helix-helix protein, copG family
LLSFRANGDNVIRTQISLDEREYTVVKTEAQSLGISVAEFIRRAIREALPPRGEGPWMKYAGFVETGNPRSSQSIDEIVYGQKR